MFLHGVDHTSVGVSIVWRSDVSAADLASDTTNLKTLLTLVPPRAEEMVEVPLWSARAARAPDVRGWTVVSRRSSELVPQFEGEGHGNQLSVAVPHQLCAGRVALASEPPAEAPDQTDSVAEARRRRQLA